MQHQSNATPEEIAWAAGLFEGEGCWNIYIRKSGKLQIQARLTMTDGDVVERFARIVGCGAVHPRHTPAHQARGDKPLFDWYVYEAEKVRAIIAVFLPYMGERRKAAGERLLAEGIGIKSHNAKKTHCPAGHPLEGDNLVLEPIRRGEKTYYARRCLECRTINSRERMRRKRGITPDRYRVKSLSKGEPMADETPVNQAAADDDPGTGTAQPPNQGQSKPDQTKGEGGQTVGEPMPMHQGSVHSEDAIKQDQPADDQPDE